MKKLVILSISLLVALTAQALNFSDDNGLWYTTNDKSEYKYQPFIMDGTCEWQSLEWRFGVDKPIVNRRVISNEDSVFQGRTYKILFDYPSCTTDEEEKEYVGLIREEDKRVYYVGRNFIGEYSDTEILLYDFNLNVGDIINYRWGSFEVSRIDTVQSFGTWRRMFHFVYANDPEYEVLDYVLEGIGTAIFQGIVDPLMEMPECCDTEIPCVIHGDEILYKDNTKVDCPCSSLNSLPDTEDLAPMSFYVRDRLLYIHSPGQRYTHLKVYTPDGKLIQSLILNQQTEEITSSLEGLTPGSYLFIVGSPESQQSGQFIVQ
ncbi:MAG: T9SS type A sorting domain-containing protein [Bacteroidales bacterium]|nr:T9SS type A sorting domain-containing protein [Bacteroidales bacterium]